MDRKDVVRRSIELNKFIDEESIQKYGSFIPPCFKDETLKANDMRDQTILGTEIIA